MSLAATPESVSLPRRRVRIEPSLLLAWLLGIAVMALSFVPMALETYRNGRLVDNDDAMRLVEVRQWLDGQGWFDLRQIRINPPDSPLSHWSRLVDVPLAAGVVALRPWVGQDAAERITTIAWPLLLVGMLLAVLLAITRAVLPPMMMLVGAVVIGLNPAVLFDLMPGRIDHHGLQMLLTTALCAASAEALFRQRRWAAEVAAGVSALMLAIGLETLPFVALGGAAFGLLWIIRGAAGRAIVMRYAAVLIGGTLALMTLTVPASRWLAPTCDAFGLPAVWLAVAGGAALLAAGVMPQPSRLTVRLAAAIGLASPMLAVFVLAWPRCLAGPYGSVDPLVMRLWLSRVSEAQPLFGVIRSDPETFLYFLMFPLIGLVGLGAAAFRERRREPRFIVLFAFAAVGFALTLNQMRSVPFASIFAVPGWLYLVNAALSSQGKSAPARLALAVASVVLLLASLPFSWTAIAIAASTSPAALPDPRCVARTDMAALAAQPPGLVLASVDLGPRIVVATGDDVLGAPYHRNNAGNRAAIEGLISDEAAAHRIVLDHGVRYVAICAGAKETKRLTAEFGPRSLIGRLATGAAPAWLSPIPQSGALQAWRVIDR